MKPRPRFGKRNSGRPAAASAIVRPVPNKGAAAPASHRATARPPGNDLDLPWHRSDRADVELLVPGQGAKLTFVLQPTATLFDRGHPPDLPCRCGRRQYGTVAGGAGADDHDLPRQRPPVGHHPPGDRPAVTAPRGARHLSGSPGHHSLNDHRRSIPQAICVPSLPAHDWQGLDRESTSGRPSGPLP